MHEAERRLATQNQLNEQLAARNAALAAEVEGLRDGVAAIEERARYELGMIQEGEFFVQLTPGPKATKNEARAAAPR